MRREGFIFMRESGVVNDGKGPLSIMGKKLSFVCKGCRVSFPKRTANNVTGLPC